MKDSLKRFVKLNRAELVVLTISLILALITGTIYFHFTATAGSKKAAASSANKEESAILGSKVAGDNGQLADGSVEGQDKERAASGESNSGQQSTGQGSSSNGGGSQQNASQKQTSESPQSQSGSSKSSRINKDSSSGNQNSSSAGAAKDQKKIVQVTLAIDTESRKREFPMEMEENSTVFELLQKASNKHGFTFSYSSNAAYGIFVEELDGVRNNPYTSKYWLYYINGKYASVGASSQRLSEGDVILWRYESSQ